MKRTTKLYTLAFSAAAVVTAGAYQFSFGRTPLSRVLGRHTRSPEFNRCRDYAAARMRTLPHQEFTLTSSRGVSLKGFYYPCGQRPSGKIAFLIHGLHSEHREAGGLYYQYYHDRGFDVFCCDHTAAGESGGRVVGYGVFERIDCLHWIEFLRSTFGHDIRILLHGFSMGGSTVLGMSCSCPENVKCIISDSAFTEAGGVLQPKMGVFYHPMRKLNRMVSGYDMDQTDVREAVRQSELPTLFVHGTADMVVPFYMGEELFSLHRGPKDSLFLEGVEHVEGMYAAPEAYIAKLDEFLSRNTNLLNH